jgi:thiol-disulfide isomerase/thioredoxin
MRIERMLPLLTLLLLLAAGGRAEEQAGSAAGRWEEAWLQGAPGMFEAIERFEQERRPLAVYFYTDWCGYCREFERRLLSTAEVQAFARKEAIAVRINPEETAEAREIASYYGVNGYPAFFIHSGNSRVVSPVSRYSGVVDGRPQFLQPEQFVENCRRAGAE